MTKNFESPVAESSNKKLLDLFADFFGEVDWKLKMYGFGRGPPMAVPVGEHGSFS